MKQEQKRVSKVVDHLLEHSFSRFQELLLDDRSDDAISIGDELYEWLRDVNSEEIIYTTAEDLLTLYNDAKRKQRRHRRKPKNI